jgi:hypothetical protein
LQLKFGLREIEMDENSAWQQVDNVLSSTW